MTKKQIIESVRSVAGSYSDASFFRDVRKLKIKPLGNWRTIPRHYPHSTPAAILSARGFETALMPLDPLAPLDTAASRLVSMGELRKLKRNRRAKR